MLVKRYYVLGQLRPVGLFGLFWSFGRGLFYPLTLLKKDGSKGGGLPPHHLFRPPKGDLTPHQSFGWGGVPPPATIWGGVGGVAPMSHLF